MLHLFIFLAWVAIGITLMAICASRKHDPYKEDNKNGQQRNTGETGGVD